jgi:hypothetical protein
MSVKVMSLVWDHYPRGGGELILALALGDWANDKGASIFPSVAQMALKTRLSERAVQYVLGKMKASGWLEQVSPGGMIAGRNVSTTYRIPIERIPQGAVGGVQKLHPLNDLSTGLSTGVQSATNRGAICDMEGCNPLHPNHQGIPPSKPPTTARAKKRPPPPPLWKYTDVQLSELAAKLGVPTRGVPRVLLITKLREKIQ